MMTRDQFDALGDLHKSYEGRNKQFHMEGLPIMVRIDGRSFSRLTKKCIRPFDSAFADAMADVAKAMINEFNALIAYHQSDEISFILPANNHIFGGNKDKINSIIAATASVVFNESVRKYAPNVNPSQIAVFDCRSFQYPDQMMYIDCLRWREADATRNSLSMACSVHFSESVLNGKGFSERHDLLHSIGINWNDYPSWFKMGSYFRKVENLIEVTDDMVANIHVNHRPPIGSFVSRNVIEEIDIPPLSEDNMYLLKNIVFGLDPESK